MKPRAAYLFTQGWAGRRKQAVVVVGETPKRYRIRGHVRVRLAGPQRWLEPGFTALVPKPSIRFIENDGKTGNEGGGN